MCGYYSKTSITDIWETLSPGGFLLWRVNEDKPPPPRTAPREPRAAPEPQPQAKPPSGERRGPRLTAPATDEPGPPSEPQGRRPPEAPPRLGAPQVSPSQQDPACRLPRLSPPEARGPLSARPPTPHPATQATRALRPRALHATCELGPGGPGLEQGRGDSAPPGAAPARPAQAPRRPAGVSGRRPRPFRLAPLDFRSRLRVWAGAGVGLQSSPCEGLSLVTLHTQPPRPHEAVLGDFEGKLRNRWEAPHSWGVGVSWTLPTRPNSVRPEPLFGRVFESSGGLFSNEAALRVGVVHPLRRTHWTPEPGPWAHLTGQRRRGGWF